MSPAGAACALGPAGWAGVDPATGYGMWYKDVKGTNGLPTGERVTTKVYSEASRYYVDKSSLPDVVGGLTNYFKYKNIDLNILFNFSYGAYVYDSTYASLMEGFKSPGRAAHQDLQSRWQKAGDVTAIPRVVFGDNVSNGSSMPISDNLEKGDFIKFRNIALGYSLPKKLLESMGLTSFRFYLSAQNAFTITSYSGFDPEISSNGNANGSPSVDRNSAPMARTFSFGLNLGL